MRRSRLVALLWSAVLLGTIAPAHAESCSSDEYGTSCSGEDGSSPNGSGESIDGGGTIVRDHVDVAVHDNHEAGEGYGSGAGGDVHGPVDVTVNLEGTGSYQYLAAGGNIDGGNGVGSTPGTGGGSPDVTARVTGSATHVIIDTRAGFPGWVWDDTTQVFGDSGAAGDITADVNVSAQHYVSLRSSGFDTSGDITATFDGAAELVEALSSSSPRAIASTSGNVELTVSGTVGYVTVDSSARMPGTVHVTLADGAVVTGTILNASRDLGSFHNGQFDRVANGTLTFAMQVASQAEYDEVAAVLSSSGATGTVTVNGNVYAWDGFDTLENLIQVIRQQDPGAEVSVTIGEPFNPQRKAAGRSAVAKCDSSRVIAVRLADGRVQLNLKPKGQRRFVLGWIDHGGFVATGADYAVTTRTVGGTVVLNIAAANGTQVARCTV